MNKRIKKVKKFLKENLKNGTIDFWGDGDVQAFNTRNMIGDTMTNIYDKDNIQIDVAFDYAYIEIFGLTKDEWDYLYSTELIY